MKQSLFYYLPLILMLVCSESCQKTNTGAIGAIGTIPFVNNDSVQLFYPPKSVYNEADQIGFTSIVIDSNNNKWMFASSSGIFRFDGTNWTRYDSANMPVNLKNYENFGLVGDSKGTIYSYLLPFTGVNVTDPVLIVYKNGSWTSSILPFQTAGISLDKATDQLYFLTGGDSIEKYNGTGSFSNLNSYSGIYLGGDYSIIGYLSPMTRSGLLRPKLPGCNCRQRPLRISRPKRRRAYLNL